MLLCFLLQCDEDDSKSMEGNAQVESFISKKKIENNIKKMSQQITIQYEMMVHDC